MSYRCFAVTIENKIARVVLNRPEKRNSMIPEFWDELPAIVRDIDDNARARVILISSTGPHFSAGLDTSAFTVGGFGAGGIADGADADEQHRARRQRGAGFYSYVTHKQGTFSAIEACRIPVIAAIQGGCIGAGVDLITACDIRYATEDAFLTIFETNIGLTAERRHFSATGQAHSRRSGARACLHRPPDAGARGAGSGLGEQGVRRPQGDA